MNPILSLLSEDGTGESMSTMRVCSLVIVLGVVGGWLEVSIAQQALQTLSPEHVGLVLGALGIKAWQRGRENPEPPKA